MYTHYSNYANTRKQINKYDPLMRHFFFFHILTKQARPEKRPITCSLGVQSFLLSTIGLIGLKLQYIHSLET